MTMERSTIVRVREGLHARPATRFVKLAKTFGSDVELIRADKSVSAKSSVKLMLLGVKEHDAVVLRATGEDEAQALAALIAFLENPEAGLDDETAQGAPPHEPVAFTPAPVPSVSQTAAPLPFADTPVQGIAASEGCVIGSVFAYFPDQIVPGNRILTAQEIPAEILRLNAAIEAVQHRMQQSLADEHMSVADRGIIAALSEIAGDEVLREDMAALIRQGRDAVSAAHPCRINAAIS